MRAALVLLLLSFSGGAAGAQANSPRDALTDDERQELRRVYRRELPVPDYLARLAQLRSTSPDERRDVARWLAGVVDQTIIDERDPASPWRRSAESAPWTDPARCFRVWLLRAMTAQDYGPAVVPALRVTLSAERDWALPLGVVARWPMPATNALIRDVIRDAATPHGLRERALALAVKRRLTVDAAVLRALAHDIIGGVRREARALIRVLRQADPGAFDFAAAARTPAFERWMKGVAPFLPLVPPKDAPFLSVRTTKKEGDDDRTTEHRGWRLAERASAITLYTPHGEWLELPIGTPNVKIRIVPPREEARLIRAFRLADEAVSTGRDEAGALDAFQAMDERITGEGFSGYEIAFAHWLFARGDRALAAEMLLPGIQWMAEPDRQVVETARDAMGQALLGQVVKHFVWERDDRRALVFAERLRDSQPQTNAGKLAKRLCDELPRRGDDFKSLRLPSPAEWRALRARLPHEEQIRFLLRRFRLITFFIEGRLLFGDKFDGAENTRPPSSAEKCSEEEWGRTAVINPYEALLGEWNYTKGGRTSPLGLSFAELPIVLPFLAERWFTRVGGWFPDWWLDDTDVPLTEIVNDLAGFSLIDTKFLALEPAARRAEIRRLVEWAKAYRDRSEGDRLVWGLHYGLSRGQNWWDHYIDLIHRLEVLKRRDAVRDILKVAEGEPESGRSVRFALDAALAIDRSTTLRLIRPWLAPSRPVLRLYAGYAYLESGQVERGRAAIADGFRYGRRVIVDGGDYERGVKGLLGEGSPQSIDVARLVFLGDDLIRGAFATFDEKEILRAFVNAGLPDTHRYFLRRLERKIPKHALPSPFYGQPLFVTPFGSDLRPLASGVIEEMKAVFTQGFGRPVRQWLQREITTREAYEAAKRKNATGR